MARASRFEAVVFDMDGVLVDTEHLWGEAREQLTVEWGGRYTPEAQQAMMGMSSGEWSRYLHETVGLREPPDAINAEVVRRMPARYDVDLPVIPGAVAAVPSAEPERSAAVEDSASRIRAATPPGCTSSGTPTVTTGRERTCSLSRTSCSAAWSASRPPSRP
jgi:beta-phosphoglucomutase-like phosphatase (HAD superfamily)